MDLLDAVGARFLFLGIHRAQDDIPLLRPAQRVRLNRPRGTHAPLVDVIELDQQPVGGGKADRLDEGRTSAADMDAAGARSQDGRSGCDGVRRQKLGHRGAYEPLKKCRQRAPERIDGGRRRQLMAEHVLPVADQLVTGSGQRREARKGHILETALLRHDLAHARRYRAELAVTEQVDHVIEIAWPRALAERPDLLPEQLIESVAAGNDPLLRLVRIGMVHAPLDRRQHQPLVGREVEPNAGQISR